MTAASGITTSGQPPTAVVNIQPGMAVQPVVLVDQNGQYITPGGSSTTAGSLATTTVPVNVAAATAPTTGQVLTATSGTTATWQAVPTNVLTTLGDTIAENSVPTAVRVSGNTTATKNFYTQTGTGSASALPVWGAIASADMPAGTTGAKGALQLDGTATDILAAGAQAAGAVGKAADSGHTHPGRDYYMRAAAILGETIPRASHINTNANATQATLTLAAIFLPAGVTIGHLIGCTGGTGITSPTHWWFGLYDSSYTQLAVTADQTNGAWGTNSYMSLAIATIASGASATFTTTYTGLHYFGMMVAWSGSGPTIMSVSQVGTGIIAQAPVLCGTSDTSQTAPPAFPHTATTPTAIATMFYAAAAT